MKQVLNCILFKRVLKSTFLVFYFVNPAETLKTEIRQIRQMVCFCDISVYLLRY